MAKDRHAADTTVLAVRVPKTLAEAFSKAARDRWLTQSEAMTVALREWLGAAEGRSKNAVRKSAK